MNNKDTTTSFPDGLKPTDLAVGQGDTTALVWDFLSNNDKAYKRGQVKIYLKTPVRGLNGSSNNNGDDTVIGPQKMEATPTTQSSTEKKEEGSNNDIISNNNAAGAAATEEAETIEASVLQYQRQQRKTQAAKRAGTLLKDDQLEIVFEDDSIVLVDKPAGVLTVPGIHNNDSIANLLCARIRREQKQESQQQQNQKEEEEEEEEEEEDKAPPANESDLCPDPPSMTVHRLDMDTSGLVVFGKTKSIVSTLHKVFRRETPEEQNKKRKKNKNGKRKKQVTPGGVVDADNKGHHNTENTPAIHAPVAVVKEYEALVCGHLPPGVESGHIDLTLQRDVHHPPFMRVSTPHSETLARKVVDALRERNWTKLSKRNPKPSQTIFLVMAREYYQQEQDHKDDKTATTTAPETERIPVTRLSLTPITGRTHQLRVHCAAMGFPIVGDPVYGIYGESAFCGGLYHNPVELQLQESHPPNTTKEPVVVDGTSSSNWRAPISLQKQLMEIHPPGEKDMCLHAKKLGFPHPITKVMKVWEVSPKF